MRKRHLVVIALVSLSAAFAFGRYSSPVKIKTITVVKRVKNQVVHETIKPDGTVEKTITTQVNTDKNTDSQTTKGGAPQINVYGLVGVQALKPVAGAHVSAEVLGPISIGVFGLTNGSVGGSVGLRF